MPDHIGAFLKASRCFAELGINITRVSYNKAVDTNTLFIDAEGSEEMLAKADERLFEIGYLKSEREGKSVVLLEFCLRDEPGSVTKILTLIDEFKFNISYISSQENGSEYQFFKMGLFADDMSRIEEFISRAEKLCAVRVIDYNHSERVYDNSIFYGSFVQSIMKTLDISDTKRDHLLVNANLAMQMLDERGLSPYKTFDSISRFARMLAENRGDAFSPRITRHRVTDSTEIITIEPPCGCNTTIIKSMDELLFVDCGYAIYEKEMLDILRELINDFDSVRKRIFLTHADLDHCGLLHLFDEIIASKKTALCISLEYEGKDGFRDKNPLHRPYINICKTLTSYSPVSPDKITHTIGDEERISAPLMQIGFLSVGELNFEVYEGGGGHIPGESVLIDYEHCICFSGDIFVNLKAMTKEQSEYNRYAPILMSSVDTDRELCTRERSALFARLGGGEWQIFSGHGAKKTYSVSVEK